MEYEEECECVELEYSSIPHPACPIHGERSQTMTVDKVLKKHGFADQPLLRRDFAKWLVENDVAETFRAEIEEAMQRRDDQRGELD
tara:strand:- start:2447 stop:2704 length:258 start_codon:yes stop_codon:yes gene_type:complete